MRIIHVADIHIGVENYGRVDSKTGMSTRLQDFLETFDELVDYAIDNSVDLVVFSGDAYKSRDPSQTHQREFAKRIARLSSAQIATFLLVGNHDTPNIIGRATSLEIFKTLDVPQVTIGDTLRNYLIQTKSGPLQILAVPWVRRSALIASNEGKGLNPDQLNEAIQERLVRAIRSNVEALDPNTPAILSGHLSVGEATLASEQSMMIGRDYVLMKSDLALPELEYIALGHIHRHQVLADNPKIVYSGSIQRVDFGEEKDEKGFCVIEIDPTLPRGNRSTAFSFQPVSARAFITISVDVPPMSPDPTETVLSEISKHDISGAVVRLHINISANLEPHLKDSVITASLQDAHFIGSVSKNITDIRRTRLESDTSKPIDPLEVLKFYLSEHGTSDERTKILVEYAERMMEDTSLD